MRQNNKKIADIQFKLGVHLVDKDLKEAMRYYRLAADKGHADAQCALGAAYSAGDGVNLNHKEALRLYKLAAAQGHAEGQCRLGIAYSIVWDIIEVDKDHEVWDILAFDVDQNKEAAHLWKLAARQGHREAQFYLGQWYLNRRENPRRGRAAKLIRAAADQGLECAGDFMRDIMKAGLVDFQVCANCAKEIISAAKCGGCERVFYCDRACAKEDWKAHKKVCKRT